MSKQLVFITLIAVTLLLSIACDLVVSQPATTDTNTSTTTTTVDSFTTATNDTRDTSSSSTSTTTTTATTETTTSTTTTPAPPTSSTLPPESLPLLRITGPHKSNPQQQVPRTIATKNLPLQFNYIIPLGDESLAGDIFNFPTRDCTGSFIFAAPSPDVVSTSTTSATAMTVSDIATLNQSTVLMEWLAKSSLFVTNSTCLTVSLSDATKTVIEGIYGGEAFQPRISLDWSPKTLQVAVTPSFTTCFNTARYFSGSQPRAMEFSLIAPDRPLATGAQHVADMLFGARITAITVGAALFSGTVAAHAGRAGVYLSLLECVSPGKAPTGIVNPFGFEMGDNAEVAPFAGAVFGNTLLLLSIAVFLVLLAVVLAKVIKKTSIMPEGFGLARFPGALIFPLLLWMAPTMTFSVVTIKHGEMTQIAGAGLIMIMMILAIVAIIMRLRNMLVKYVPRRLDYEMSAADKAKKLKQQQQDKDKNGSNNSNNSNSKESPEEAKKRLLLHAQRVTFQTKFVIKRREAINEERMQEFAKIRADFCQAAVRVGADVTIGDDDATNSMGVDFSTAVGVKALSGGNSEADSSSNGNTKKNSQNSLLNWLFSTTHHWVDLSKAERFTKKRMAYLHKKKEREESPQQASGELDDDGEVQVRSDDELSDNASADEAEDSQYYVDADPDRVTSWASSPTSRSNNNSKKNNQQKKSAAASAFGVTNLGDLGLDKPLIDRGDDDDGFDGNNNNNSQHEAEEMLAVPRTISSTTASPERQQKNQNQRRPNATSANGDDDDAGSVAVDVPALAADAAAAQTAGLHSDNEHDDNNDNDGDQQQQSSSSSPTSRRYPAAARRFNRRYGLLVREYNSQCYWFYAVELILTFLVGVLEGVKFTSTACAASGAIVALLLIVYLGLIAWKKPFQLGIDYLFVIGATFTQIAAGAFFLYGRLNHDQGSVESSMQLIAIACYIIMLRSLLHLLHYFVFHVFLSKILPKIRKKMQDRRDAEARKKRDEEERRKAALEQRREQMLQAQRDAFETKLVMKRLNDLQALEQKEWTALVEKFEAAKPTVAPPQPPEEVEEQQQQEEAAAGQADDDIVLDDEGEQQQQAQEVAVAGEADEDIVLDENENQQQAATKSRSLGEAAAGADSDLDEILEQEDAVSAARRKKLDTAEEEAAAAKQKQQQQQQQEEDVVEQEEEEDLLGSGGAPGAIQPDPDDEVPPPLALPAAGGKNSNNNNTQTVAAGNKNNTKNVDQQHHNNDDSDFDGLTPEEEEQLRQLQAKKNKSKKQQQQQDDLEKQQQHQSNNSNSKRIAHDDPRRRHERAGGLTQDEVDELFEGAADRDPALDRAEEELSDTGSEVKPVRYKQQRGAESERRFGRSTAVIDEGEDDDDDADFHDDRDYRALARRAARGGSGKHNKLDCDDEIDDSVPVMTQRRGNPTKAVLKSLDRSGAGGQEQQKNQPQQQQSQKQPPAAKNDNENDDDDELLDVDEDEIMNDSDVDLLIDRLDDEDERNLGDDEDLPDDQRYSYVTPRRPDVTQKLYPKLSGNNNNNSSLRSDGNVSRGLRADKDLLDLPPDRRPSWAYLKPEDRLRRKGLLGKAEPNVTAVGDDAEPTLLSREEVAALNNSDKRKQQQQRRGSTSNSNNNENKEKSPGRRFDAIAASLVPRNPRLERPNFQDYSDEDVPERLLHDGSRASGARASHSSSSQQQQQQQQQALAHSPYEREKMRRKEEGYTSPRHVRAQLRPEEIEEEEYERERRRRQLVGQPRRGESIGNSNSRGRSRSQYDDEDNGEISPSSEFDSDFDDPSFAPASRNKNNNKQSKAKPAPKSKEDEDRLRRTEEQLKYNEQRLKRQQEMANRVAAAKLQALADDRERFAAMSSSSAADPAAGAPLQQPIGVSPSAVARRARSGSSSQPRQQQRQQQQEYLEEEQHGDDDDDYYNSDQYLRDREKRRAQRKREAAANVDDVDDDVVVPEDPRVARGVNDDDVEPWYGPDATEQRRRKFQREQARQQGRRAAAHDDDNDDLLGQLPPPSQEYYDRRDKAKRKQHQHQQQRTIDDDFDDGVRKPRPKTPEPEPQRHDTKLLTLAELAALGVVAPDAVTAQNNVDRARAAVPEQQLSFASRNSSNNRTGGVRADKMLGATALEQQQLDSYPDVGIQPWHMREPEDIQRMQQQEREQQMQRQQGGLYPAAVGSNIAPASAPFLGGGSTNKTGTASLILTPSVTATDLTASPSWIARAREQREAEARAKQLEDANRLREADKFYRGMVAESDDPIRQMIAFSNQQPDLSSYGSAALAAPSPSASAAVNRGSPSVPRGVYGGRGASLASSPSSSVSPSRSTHQQQQQSSTSASAAAQRIHDDPSFIVTAILDAPTKTAAAKNAEAFKKLSEHL